jgi:hypothetical protein
LTPVSSSSTAIVKLPVAVLPALSAAVQVTVVVPTWKMLPEAGVQVTGPGRRPGRAPRQSSPPVAIRRIGGFLNGPWQLEGWHLAVAHADGEAAGGGVAGLQSGAASRGPLGG